MPFFQDQEGQEVPSGLPRIIDAHVHFSPRNIYLNDEISAYRKLIEKYNNLWLDTTMAISGYFPAEEEISLGGYRPDRIMYGSHFPNIPYEWDRELKIRAADNISDEALERIACKNAADFFNLDLTDTNPQGSSTTQKKSAGCRIGKYFKKDHQYDLCRSFSMAYQFRSSLP